MYDIYTADYYDEKHYVIMLRLFDRYHFSTALCTKYLTLWRQIFVIMDIQLFVHDSYLPSVRICFSILCSNSEAGVHNDQKILNKYFYGTTYIHSDLKQVQIFNLEFNPFWTVIIIKTFIFS